MSNPGAPVRIFAIDLDDTLLDDRWQITSDNRLALERLSNSGVEVCIISGRMPGSMRRVLEGFSFVNYIGCYHGAIVQEFISRVTLSSMPIAYSDVAILMEWKERSGLRFIYFIGDAAVSEHSDPVVSFYEQRTGITVKIGQHANVNALLGQVEISKLVVYKVAETGSYELLSEEELLLSAASLPLRSARSFKTGLGYIEFTHSEATKATALRSLSERLSTPLSHTAAIGDSHNDLDMLLVAGYSFAVGNAVPEVRESVDYVVASNTEGGVAQAVQIIERINQGSALNGGSK
jgi:hypothetical protein